MQCMGNLGFFLRGKRAAIVRRNLVVVFSCVQCFVSVIHRTLSDIWTTGSLTCVRSYACVYTGGWGTLTMSQDQHFDSEKLSQIFLVLWTGFEPLVMESIGSRGWRSHPSLLLYRYKRALLENVSNFSYLGIRNAWDPCSRGSTFLSVEPNSWSKLLTDSMFVNK